MRLVGACAETLQEVYAWLKGNAEGWFTRSLGIDPEDYSTFAEWAAHHEWLIGDCSVVFVEKRGHIALLHPAINPRCAELRHDDFMQVEHVLALQGIRRMEIGVRLTAGRSIRRFLSERDFHLEGIKRGALYELDALHKRKALHDLEIWSKLLGEGDN